MLLVSLSACTNTKVTSKEVQFNDTEKTEINEHLAAVDSLLNVIDTTMKEINESHKNLDKALKNFNNP